MQVSTLVGNPTPRQCFCEKASKASSAHGARARPGAVIALTGGPALIDSR
jgi:hypothetical protein